MLSSRAAYSRAHIVTPSERELNNASENTNNSVPLPNEIKQMILGLLPTSCLKKVRLACRDLASLGEFYLLNTVFISPREKDMEVFDCITSGKASIRRRVKNIVFDSAQFQIRTERAYFADLCEQLSLPQLKYLIMSNRDLKTLIKTILGSNQDAPDSQSLRQYGSLPDAYERCQGNPAFNKGLEQYFIYAKQHRRLLDPNWFLRVVHGLQMLGDIDMVEICSTFNTTFFEHDDDVAASSPDTLVDDPSRDDNTFTYRFSNPAIPEALDHFKGTLTRGSPVARSWPPTALCPAHPAYYYRTTSEDGLRDENISNGCFEISKLGQILQAAAKYPREFLAPGRHYAARGIPNYMFEGVIQTSYSSKILQRI